MKKNTLLIVSFLMIVSILVSACGGITPESTIPPVTEQPSIAEPIGPPPTLYNESPMLADKVVTGDLPSVDDRLPPDPMIIEPYASIGEYGGIWNTVTGDPEAGDIELYLYDPPIRWKADLTGYEPGLATYEWSDEGKTFTLNFKKGIKWSDGVGFTMEDIKFWWEDMATNEDLKTSIVPWYMYKSDGKTPIDMEFPDEYTWVWKSDQPMWITPYIMAQGFWEWEPMIKPKHFLQEYHPLYNTEASYRTFEQIDSFLETPGYPCLFAWCLEAHIAGESWLFARNPYYWKVDTKGNQLPYIDYMHLALVQDKQTRMSNITQGKYDTAFRVTNNPLDIPLLAEKAEVNDYAIYPGWMNGAGAWPGWEINQNYAGDEPEADEIRDMLRNKWFRKALSISLDRIRFVNVVWKGNGTPQQATISRQSWHFVSGEGPVIFKEWQQTDAVLDVPKAEEFFERAKFVDQDGDGWRDLPSGKPFEMVLDLGDWGGAVEAVDTAVFVKEYWEAVGVKIVVNNLVNQPDWNVRLEKGLYMLRNTQVSALDSWTNPDWIFPLRNSGAWPLNGLYSESSGTEGWEPESGSPAARLKNLYDSGSTTYDEQKRHEIVWEAIRIHMHDGPFTIGLAGDQYMPVIVKIGFHNIRESGVISADIPASPGNLNPEQFWMEAGLQ